MARPLVIVYQDYAALNTPTVASADLNTCVVGVAKKVVDYSSDAPAQTKVTDTYQQLPLTSIKPVGLLPYPLMVLEKASVKVKFIDPLKQKGGLRAGVIRHATDKNILEFTPGAAIMSADGKSVTGVAPGDSVYGEDSTGALVDLGSVKRVVRVPADTSLAATRVDVYVATDVPNTALVEGSETELRALRVVDKLPGVHDVRPVHVDSDPVSGTVQVDATASVSFNDATITIVKCDNIHVEYVARRTDKAFLQDISDASQVESELGVVDPRNPLALGVWTALQNTPTKVIAYGVPEDTSAAYAAFSRVAMPREDIYCIVPLCMNPDTQLTVVTSMRNKVMDMSRAEYALANGVPQRFKMVVAGGFPQVTDVKNVSTVGTFTQTALSPGVYRIDMVAGKFFDHDVQAGDAVTSVVNEWFDTDGGQVLEVISNTALVVHKPSDSGYTGLDTTKTYTVTRRLDEAMIVDAMVGTPAGVGSRRVVMVMGESVNIGGEAVSTAYLACAVGGMIAGLPSHAGLTNLSVAGITDIQGTHTHFSEESLSRLSNAGWCVFVENNPADAPYCIHGVTTDSSALEFSEIMSVKNFDYIATLLALNLKQFIGVWNLNEQTLGFITSTLGNVLTELQSRNTPKLGAPLTASTIDSIGQSSSNADRAEVYVTLRMPKSLNNIGLHLVSA